MSKFWKWFKFYILGQPTIFRFGDSYRVMRFCTFGSVAYDEFCNTWSSNCAHRDLCTYSLEQAQEILRKVKINGEIL